MQPVHMSRRSLFFSLLLQRSAEETFFSPSLADVFAFSVRHFYSLIDGAHMLCWYR
jgi:hypothetical protein